MTYTQHGHDIPGTPPVPGTHEDRAECGGIGRCIVCTIDGAAAMPAALARLQARVRALEKQVESQNETTKEPT
jgi:hypothetical protein